MEFHQLIQYLYYLKRTLAILAFSIYLFGATDAYQLLKIPLFIKHFVIHQKQNPSLSLTGFIKIHYLDPLVIDDDFDQDMQLPFKTHETDGCMISAISIPIQKMAIEVPPMVITPIVYSMMEESPYFFIPMVNIFQPPRTNTLV